MLEWRFWPDFYWDERVSYYTVEGRGGARYKSFDYQRVKDLPPFPEIGAVDEKEMWARFLHFARPVVAATLLELDKLVRRRLTAQRLAELKDALRQLMELE